MTTLSRRGFLRGTVALGAGAILYRYAGGFRIVTAQPGDEVRRLRIVHNNDHHSRIEPATGITIGRNAAGANVTRNLGGVARRKTLFDQLRADATGTQDKLFLDAGDVFQGTLYFNQFNGKADKFFYNALGYAAMTLGNHEFDKGDGILAEFIGGVAGDTSNPPLAFPVVSANLEFAAGSTSPLIPLYAGDVDVTPPGKWGKRTIVTLPSGEKVGLFGLTTVETANIASPNPGTLFNQDYVGIANAQAVALKAAGCNTVIALTHIGYQADLTLAPQLTGVDLIIGGHSHTPLLPNNNDPKPFGATGADVYPKLLTGKDGKNIVVVQDWEWAKWIGDLTLGFNAAGDVTSVTGTIRPVWADGIAVTNGTPRPLINGEGAEITPDPAFQTAIGDATSGFKQAIIALQNTVVGATEVELSNANARAGEGVLGNLIADAFRAKAQTFADNDPNIPVVALVNGGGIRTSIAVGSITLGKLLEVQPFGNTLSRVDVTGAQLKAALENGLSALPPGAAVDAARNAVGNGRFPNVSGLKFSYNPYGRAAQQPLAATSTQAAVPAFAGNRVTKVEVEVSPGVFEALSPTKIYRVITLNFITNGGDGYNVFTSTGTTADPSLGGAKNRIEPGFIDVDVFAEYIQSLPNDTITAANVPTGGRITVAVTLNLPLVSNQAPAAQVVTAGE